LTTSSTYPSGETLSERVRLLIRKQKADWPLLRQNYAGLDKTESKSFSFGEFQIVAQFNPPRIRSSAAKTDEQSIRRRACFLCEGNRPKEQRGIDVNGKYTILVNPFPIFPEHLTIPLNEHLPQNIEPYFPDMLQLSLQLPGFTIFYNGPQCGASAPDHFHFQAGTRKIMPVDLEIEKILTLYGELLLKDEWTTIQAVGKEYLRKFIFLSSTSETETAQHFLHILGILKERGQEEEPMMNILSDYEKGRWRVIIFPRDKQRPWQFFAEGDKQILMSPASVEFGGFSILPGKEDFDKLSKDDLNDIFSQVTINDTDFDQVKKKIKNQR